MPPKVKFEPKSEADLGSMLVQMLRKKSRNPDITGYKPHFKQLEFHQSLAPQRLYIGGNRAGKTVGGGVEAVWWLTGKHPYRRIPDRPINGRIVASDFLQGVDKIVLPMVSRWIPPSALINGAWEDSYKKEGHTLTLANGSTVEFLSYDQDLVKFAGTSRDFVWFDEEPPQDIFQECIMRTLDVSGSIWATLTPVDGMTWIYDGLYLKGLDPTNLNVHVTEVLTTDNPYLPVDAVDTIKEFYTEDELEARLKGRFVQRAGIIYPEFSRDNNVVPFLENTPPKNHLWVAGLDHGLKNATVWLWASVDPQGNILIWDEYYETERVVSEHAEHVHRINLEHAKAPDYYIGDPSIRNREPLQGSSVLEEYASNGIYIGLANNDLKAGYSRVKARFAGLQSRKLTITENCVHTINEISRLRWATYATKRIANDNNAKEEQHKKDDHSCDALRYIVMSRPELMDQGTELPDSVMDLAKNVIPHREAFEDGTRRARINKPVTTYYDEYTGAA